MESGPGIGGKVSGSCHCGAVRFTVDLPQGWSAHRCNCSLCRMKGNVMVDVPLAALTILEGEDDLTLYRFNTGVARHRFCRNCGIHPFHRLRSEPDKYGINAVCLDGVSPYDFIELPVHDGERHPSDNDGVQRVAGVLRFEAKADDPR